AGDRVLALDHSTGRLAYRPLYIFVHREPAAFGTFVNIEAAPLAVGRPAPANATRRLQLSPRHFLPVCATGDAAACGRPRLGGLLDSLRSSLTSWQHRYGREVQPGMLVLAPGADGQLTPARGGTLVVDGVLASDQSDWVLGDIVPASWRRHLPAVYGVVMSPLRLLFHLLGPAGLEALDSALGIIWLGRNHSKQMLAALPAGAVAWAVAAVAANCCM
ncbi:hypothetical protein ABPG75_010947, partial [Micractinium tetrahymenae]